MDEASFWSALEHRVCKEMRGLEPCRRAGLWCDGFLPDERLLDDAEPRITGRVWLGRGPREQEQWAFTLHVDERVARSRTIDWDALMPQAGAAGWLAVDLARRRLEITPARAS